MMIFNHQSKQKTQKKKI